MLLIGGRRARSQRWTVRRRRERYVYACLVAIVRFSRGGLYARYEGYHKVSDPHLRESPLVAVVVLVLAASLEGYALHTAVTEANRTRGDRSWLRFVRRTRSPELAVILLEDSGALLGLLFALAGVGLSVLIGDGILDGIATVASARCWSPSQSGSRSRPRA